MSHRLPITVLIPTLNAEGHLNELFDGIVSHVQDIKVVDSYSKDKTIDICLSRGIHVVQRHYKSSSDQFRWMLKELNVKTPWIFFMAQDERLSASLIEKLHGLLDGPDPAPDIDGYTVDWRLWFMGRPLHAMAPNLRLLRTGKCDVSQVACNEHHVVEGRVAHLGGILEHKDTLNLHEWYAKQNLWTTREAIQRVAPPSDDERPILWGGTKAQKRAWVQQVLIHMPFGEFVYFWYYLLKFGAWKDGRAGWTWAKLRVWVLHVTTLKEIEMRRFGVPKVWPEANHGEPDNRVAQF